MSSSYRNRKRCGGAAVAAIAVACAGPRAVVAADTYFQPQIELRGEYHDNYPLDPDELNRKNRDAAGAAADIGATIGILTPRSTTEIRPTATFQEFSNNHNIPNFEGYLDWLTQYRSERSTFDLIAKYSHRDASNPEAQFDDLDPNDPNTPETGSNDVSETRDRYEIRPSYSYDLTQRWSIGVGLDFDAIRYSSQAVATRVDYDYIYGNLFATWALDQRSHLKGYVFGSNYDAKQGINQTDAYGAGVAYIREWSEQTGFEIDTFYEHDKSTFDVLLPDETSSSWGATLSAYREGEVDRWRLAVGRSFTPNARGYKSESDQVRLQYDRDLSQRLSFLGAVRYISDQAIGDFGQNDDRDFARLDLGLRWQMSPTWYARTTYTYRWQDRDRDPGDADDNAFIIGIGYEGLAPPGSKLRH
jgi:hypothetical protein